MDLDLARACDAMADAQKLKFVRIEAANAVADGRDAIELTQKQWVATRELARKHGVVLGDDDIVLSREEASRFAHALRIAGTPNATTRRMLVVLGKNGGLMVTGTGTR